MGGTKEWKSETNFAKMYVTAFPLRVTMVFDDCPNVGVLYDEAFPKLVTLNEDPTIQDKVLLRKQLRCLHGKEVMFPIQRWEKKKVNKTTRTTDEKGNVKQTTERVQIRVLINYTMGEFVIEQTDSKNTMKTAGTEFDLRSPYFDVHALCPACYYVWSTLFASDHPDCKRLSLFIL